MRGARSEYRTEPGSILVPGVSGVGKMVNHRQVVDVLRTASPTDNIYNNNDQ